MYCAICLKGRNFGKSLVSQLLVLVDIGGEKQKAWRSRLRLRAASRFSHKSVESVRALRGASGEAARNEGASPRE